MGLSGPGPIPTGSMFPTYSALVIPRPIVESSPPPAPPSATAVAWAMPMARSEFAARWLADLATEWPAWELEDPVEGVRGSMVQGPVPRCRRGDAAGRHHAEGDPKVVFCSKPDSILSHTSQLN
jgi:hypothetical protein